jgi:hypothetical protein
MPAIPVKALRKVNTSSKKLLMDRVCLELVRYCELSVTSLFERFLSTLYSVDTPSVRVAWAEEKDMPEVTTL